MPYNEQVKWIGINKAEYPIRIIECGIERIIPPTNYQKNPQQQMIKLHSSCFDEYKDLFHVVLPPQEQSEKTIIKNNYIQNKIERLKEKPLAYKQTAITKSLQDTRDKVKAGNIINKPKPKHNGAKNKFVWIFENTKTGEVVKVDKNVSKYCNEIGLAVGNLYYFEKQQKLFNGIKITKELIGE